MYCVINKFYDTISAGRNVPVSVAEAIVQISASKTTVAAIVQITERLPQQDKRHEGPQYTP